ncbi:MAG: hypothetical protein WCT31_03015 [Candidatus Micrarchaeia archaeon]|jgi:hypothetical protein
MVILLEAKIDEIERAFQNTSELLLGKRLSNLPEYKEWLFENVDRSIKVNSQVSRNSIYMPNIAFFSAIKRNMVTLEESVELGKKEVGEQTASSVTLANASGKLKEIKYVTSDVIVGQNLDLRETSTCMGSQHCLDGCWYIYSKCDAYCFWPSESEYSFGCQFICNSKFCIKCYSSVNLTRCFEVNDSHNSSDCYFCNNVENLQNCMFCFNVKSLKYAIGNVEVGREKFFEIKNRLMNEVASKLEKDKRLDLNIYNFGCFGK